MFASCHISLYKTGPSEPASFTNLYINLINILISSITFQEVDYFSEDSFWFSSDVYGV